ncbi:MAG TPA: 4-(cytidine 5'-diphospho)-2-C-methyl-D-erythritol kinase [Methyloceanibacter sp.]|jgi:4-diphosphocytidyl-2-C-methyl-D-erythritol kinase|nr:4-(cytidine 5'-diphospho)-2-C-methyl-D-erythritol kinase [Methyloceanibacter sp.]
MTALRDTAWAKLNLTLEVLGRRADGFHELQSLVAFAGLGDTVEFDPSAPFELVVEGPFASALGGDNLIVKAAQAASAAHPGLRLGRFLLIKVLPVAAGLGGGSADAAAALRLIGSANDGALPEAELALIAPRLGSDVSACLKSRPALMTGRGEIVSSVRGFPPCGVLLANPGLPLATEAVYAALGAAPLPVSPANALEPPDFAGSLEWLLDYLARRGNDLEAPAMRLAPAIKQVLAALAGVEGVRLVRLSGSGPTCFALFATADEAEREAAALARSHPDWWIAASALGAAA